MASLLLECGKSTSEEMLYGAFAVLLSLLLCAQEDSFAPVKIRFSPTVLRIRRYIAENFSDKLSVFELARRFYISHSYLCHSFEEWYGISPKKYITLLRCEAAKKALRRKDSGLCRVGEVWIFR